MRVYGADKVWKRLNPSSTCSRAKSSAGVSPSMQIKFVLDAPERPLYARRGGRAGELIHHSDSGLQYVSIRYSEHLAEAGIEPFAGSRGDR